MRRPTARAQAAAKPALAGFKAVMQSTNAKLTAAERRLASILLADPQSVLLLSAAELAAKAKVHESTAIRFAQKLGYAGYPELRTDLMADVRQSMATRTPSPAIRMTSPHELSSLIDGQIQTLSRIPEHVSQEALDSAAKALLGAKRIFVYGQDFARPLVEFMERRLRCMGLSVIALRHSDDVAEHLVSASSSDALLAFAFERHSHEAARLLRRAEAAGIETILVTDHLNVMIRPAPKHLLAAPRSYESRKTIITPMVIAYALEYAVFHQAPERLGANLELVAAMREDDERDGQAESRADALRYEFPWREWAKLRRSSVGPRGRRTAL